MRTSINKASSLSALLAVSQISELRVKRVEIPNITERPLV